MAVMKNIIHAGMLLVAGVSATSGRQCREVFFDVSASATNLNITGIPTDTLANLIAGLAKASPIPVSGTQRLGGTYCLPNVSNANNNKLQMLFGSITANRDSWNGLGGVGSDFPSYQPDYYSWTLYANNKGYPTLAMDRLGNGRSSHPDPVLVVQAPYEIALYNALAAQVRKGTPQLGRAYKYLIYIGNSYGSQLGTGTAGADPTAYDSYILTGYSKNVQQGFVGVSLALPAPAAVVDPARFGNLPLGYVTTSSQTGRTNSFFGSKQQVDFDDTVATLFFQRKDVVSLGQFVSVYGLPYYAPAYKGRVLVLTGEQDQAFCGPGSPVIGPASCGPLLKETGVLFPSAKYNYKSVDRVGHAIAEHTRSPVAFDIAHKFLAGQNYQGGPPA